MAHHLFDIRLIVRRTIIYSTLLLILLAVYSSVVLVITSALGRQNVLDYRILTANIVSSFLISLGFNPLSNWLEDKTDRFLFRKDYEQQLLLKEISHKLNDVLGLDEALEIVMQGLVRTFRLQHSATYVFQMGENNQVVVKRIRQIGYESHAKLMVDEKDFFTTFFSARESILIIERMRSELVAEELKIRKAKKDVSADAGQMERVYTIKKAVLKKLDSLNAAVAIPLRINNQPIGVILLSPKLSQEPFDQEDLSLIDLVGAQVVASIQKARLYEGDQMKSEFVSIASHELLTPISAMEGYLSMILDENIGKIDTQTRGYLDKVYASAKRLSLLVKDMLSVSRIEAGQMKIEPQQMDLDKIIRDSFDQLKFTAKDKKIELIYEPPKSKLPPIWADSDRTIQVLINLIGNSIKYTQQGSITVKVLPHPSEGMIQVDVKDTGVGMAKEQQAHLFEKFYRVYSQDTADVPGTGLGLYITKSLVEKMGGQIWVNSVQGEGSTFSFTVPIFTVELSHMQ